MNDVSSSDEESEDTVVHAVPVQKRARSPPKPASSVDPRDWTPEEVGDWVANLGVNLAKYKKEIVENAIDGSCIEEIGEEEWQILNISTFHGKVIRRRFRFAVQQHMTTVDRED